MTGGAAERDPLARALLTFLLVALLVGVAALLLRLPHMTVSVEWRISLACLGAACFGAMVGMVELLARYRDDPLAAIGTIWALVYILLNALVAAAVFILLISNRLPIVGGFFEREHVALNAAFTAGFGGMALLRASFANIRHRERTFPVGPAFVLQVLLDFLDRSVDRLRGTDRAALVREIMQGVVYNRAKKLLPFTAVALLQNLSLEEKSNFTIAVKAVDEAEGQSHASRLHQLGLVLMDVLGPVLLRRVVDSLGDRIRGPAYDDPSMPILGRAKQFEVADLPAVLALCRALSRNLAGAPLDNRDNWEALLDESCLPEGDLPEGAAITGSNRVAVALAAMRAHFGEETLSLALETLLGARPDEEEPGPREQQPGDDAPKPKAGGQPDPGPPGNPAGGAAVPPDDLSDPVWTPPAEKVPAPGPAAASGVAEAGAEEPLAKPSEDMPRDVAPVTAPVTAQVIAQLTSPPGPSAGDDPVAGPLPKRQG